MARKTTRSSVSRKSTRSSTGPKARPATTHTPHSPDDSLATVSLSRAREFVGTNAHLQTAGIALAGAGILAMVSTEAGRKLIKTAKDAVVHVVQKNVSTFTSRI
jgi:hypothetical protein